MDNKASASREGEGRKEGRKEEKIEYRSQSHCRGLG